MECWHSIKINKCLALETIIEFNGWCVELFPVDVGARRYCSKSVLCCFNTLIRNTIKKLSKSSMECSFCIWLARNKDWTPSTVKCHLSDPSKETSHSPSSLSSLKETIKPVSNAKTTHHVGLTNKGNTCYANSILQVLNLWNRVPSESNTFSTMLQDIGLNTAVKKNSTKPVDPSNVL